LAFKDVSDGLCDGDSDTVGRCVVDGRSVGTSDGAILGAPVGAPVGGSDGALEGDPDGSIDGEPDGDEDGRPEGIPLGTLDGKSDGFIEGDSDGDKLGIWDGLSVGSREAGISSTTLHIVMIRARMTEPDRIAIFIRRRRCRTLYCVLSETLFCS
jgi:hypothetical protein